VKSGDTVDYNGPRAGSFRLTNEVSESGSGRPRVRRQPWVAPRQAGPTHLRRSCRPRGGLPLDRFNRAACATSNPPRSWPVVTSPATLPPRPWHLSTTPRGPRCRVCPRRWPMAAPRLVRSSRWHDVPSVRESPAARPSPRPRTPGSMKALRIKNGDGSWLKVRSKSDQKNQRALMDCTMPRCGPRCSWPPSDA